MTGSRPTNSGIRPYFSRSSGSTSRKISPCFLSSGAMTLAPKPIEPGRLRAEIIFFEASEGATTDEQDADGIDLQEFLLRMLAAALRRHTRHRALHDLEQRLLHALARYVAGDRRVVGFAGNSLAPAPRTARRFTIARRAIPEACCWSTFILGPFLARPMTTANEARSNSANISGDQPRPDRRDDRRPPKKPLPH